MQVYFWSTERIHDGKNEHGTVIITADSETEAWYTLMNTDIEAWTYLQELDCNNPRKKPEVISHTGYGRSYPNANAYFSVDLSSPKP